MWFVEKAMATHSSTLAWKIPWTEEPGRLQSMGSLRVGHDWATSLSLFTFMHWRRKWQPTPVLLPGESQGWGSLVGYCLWGRTESDTTEATQQQQQGVIWGLIFNDFILGEIHYKPADHRVARNQETRCCLCLEMNWGRKEPGFFTEFPSPDTQHPGVTSSYPREACYLNYFWDPARGTGFGNSEMRLPATCPLQFPPSLSEWVCLVPMGQLETTNPFTQWCQRAPSGSWKTNFFAAKGCAAQDTNSYPLTEITALTLVCHGQICDAHSTATQHGSVPSAPRVWG